VVPQCFPTSCPARRYGYCPGPRDPDAFETERCTPLADRASSGAHRGCAGAERLVRRVYQSLPLLLVLAGTIAVAGYGPVPSLCIAVLAAAAALAIAGRSLHHPFSVVAAVQSRPRSLLAFAALDAVEVWNGDGAHVCWARLGSRSVPSSYLKCEWRCGRCVR